MIGMGSESERKRCPTFFHSFNCIRVAGYHFLGLDWKGVWKPGSEETSKRWINEYNTYLRLGQASVMSTSDGLYGYGYGS